MGRSPSSRRATLQPRSSERPFAMRNPQPVAKNRDGVRLTDKICPKGGWTGPRLREHDPRGRDSR